MARGVSKGIVDGAARRMSSQPSPEHDDKQAEESFAG